MKFLLFSLFLILLFPGTAFAVPNAPCLCPPGTPSVCAAADTIAPGTCDAGENCILNASTANWACQATATSVGGTPLPPITFSAPTTTTTFAGFLCNIIGFINTTLLPPIAVFMTLLAGFFFMLSGQDPQKATLARRILFYTVVGIALFILAPGIVALISSTLGATGAFLPVSCSSTMTASKVTDVIVNLINWFAWFIALVSVAMGLYAGFLYMTSKGDPRKTQQAAKTLSYTIIGIAVSVVAFSLISLVKAFLG